MPQVVVYLKSGKTLFTFNENEKVHWTLFDVINITAGCSCFPAHTLIYSLLIMKCRCWVPTQCRRHPRSASLTYRPSASDKRWAAQAFYCQLQTSGRNVQLYAPKTATQQQIYFVGKQLKKYINIEKYSKNSQKHRYTFLLRMHLSNKVHSVCFNNYYYVYMCM